MDKMLNIVSYKNNIRMVYYFLQYITVDEMIQCYFSNNFEYIKNKIIKNIGSDVFDTISNLVRNNRNIDISNKVFKEIKMELGV